MHTPNNDTNDIESLLNSEERARRAVRLAMEDLRAAIRNLDSTVERISSVEQAGEVRDTLGRLSGVGASALGILERLCVRPGLDLMPARAAFDEVGS